MYALDFMLKMYARSANMRLQSVFNYSRKTLPFLYARKSGRKRIKILTVYFLLNVVAAFRSFLFVLNNGAVKRIAS